MSTPARSATPTKCEKCQNDVETAASSLCKDCVPLKPRAEEDPKAELIKEELETDLTTTETLDELDELDAKLAIMQEKQAVSDPKPKPSAIKEAKDCKEVAIKAEPTEGAAPASEPKVATQPTVVAATTSSATQTKQGPSRGGKVTRSCLNGTRSPTIIKRLRKSTRSTRFKSKLTGRGNNATNNGAANGHNGIGAGATASSGAGSAAHAAGGKAHGKAGAGGGGGGAAGARNRRTLFKRPAQKTPRVQACTRFVNSVFYKGSYMQIGDIVSIVDSKQNVYYAQVRGLLVDAYCEKSAFLTWLIPTQDSPDPQEGFDPATYLIGPDEELSRKLCFLDFVMHAPSNYYYDRTTPFPLPDVDEYTTQRAGGFIWTRLPTIKREREREREKERERKAAA